MAEQLFREDFGKQEIEIIFWEDSDTKEVTFTEGQQRIIGFASAVNDSGDGSQLTFLAKNDRGEVRRFTFMNISGKVSLFAVAESAMEEPLLDLGGLR